jgi:peroxiredoxin
MASAARARVPARRLFHASPASFVKAGDPIPDLPVLVEDSPGNKVNLAEEFSKGDGLIIGVPAAFSGACSQSHVPSYMQHPAIKDVGQVFVVSVNDAFVFVFSLLVVSNVMANGFSVRRLGRSRWTRPNRQELVSPVQFPATEHAFSLVQFRFLGDPSASFTKALDLDFDGTAIFGGVRSKRYALVVKDGKITSAHVEPDNTGTNGKAEEALSRPPWSTPLTRN